MQLLSEYFQRYSVYALLILALTAFSVHIYHLGSFTSPLRVRYFGPDYCRLGNNLSPAILVTLEKSGTPVEQAKITLELRYTGSQQAMKRVESTVHGLTDARGLSRPMIALPTTISPGTYELNLSVRHASGKTHCSIPISILPGINAYLVSSAAAYQAGKKVTLLCRLWGAESIVNREVTFEVFSPREELIHRETTISGEDGCAETGFPLGEFSQTGVYQACVSYDGGETRTAFRVIPKPLKSIVARLELSRAHYLSSQRAEGLAIVLDSTKRPVTGEPVIVRVALQGAGILNEYSGSTDETGAFRFSVPFVKYASSLHSPSLLLASLLMPRESNKILAYDTASVSPEPVLFEVVPAGGGLVPLVPNEVFLLSYYASGLPAEASLTVGEQTVRTGLDGVGKCIVMPDSARLKGICKIMEKSGNVSEKTVVIPERAPCHKYISLRPSATMVMSGEKLTFTVASRRFKEVLVRASDENGVISEDLVNLNNGTGKGSVVLHGHTRPATLCAYQLDSHEGLFYDIRSVLVLGGNTPVKCASPNTTLVTGETLEITLDNPGNNEFRNASLRVEARLREGMEAIRPSVGRTRFFNPVLELLQGRCPVASVSPELVAAYLAQRSFTRPFDVTFDSLSSNKHILNCFKRGYYTWLLAATLASILIILILLFISASAYCVGIIRSYTLKDESLEGFPATALISSIKLAVAEIIGLCLLCGLREFKGLPDSLISSAMILLALFMIRRQLNLKRLYKTKVSFSIRFLLWCSVYWIVLWILFFELYNLVNISDLGDSSGEFPGLLVYPASLLFLFLLWLTTRMITRTLSQSGRILALLSIVLCAGLTAVLSFVAVKPFILEHHELPIDSDKPNSLHQCISDTSPPDTVFLNAAGPFEAQEIISSSSILIKPGDLSAIALPLKKVSGRKHLTVTAHDEGFPRILLSDWIDVSSKLAVRVEWPGTLISGDKIWLPVSIRNLKSYPQIVRVSLDITGPCIQPGDHLVNLGLSPGESVRCFFPLTVNDDGEVAFRLSMTTGETSRIFRCRRQIMPSHAHSSRGLVGTGLVETSSVIEGEGLSDVTVVVYPSITHIAGELWDTILSQPSCEFSTAAAKARLAVSILARSLSLADNQSLEEAARLKALAKECRSVLPELYRDLLRFRSNDGSFCRASGLSGDLLITARAVELLALMETWIAIDENVKSGAEWWLFARQQDNGSWQLKGEELMSGEWLEFPDARLGCTAEVLRRLRTALVDSRATRRAEMFLRDEWSDSLEDPYTLALSVLALRSQPFSRGDVRHIQKVLKRKIRIMVSDCFFESRLAPPGLSVADQSNLQVAALVIKSMNVLAIQPDWKNGVTQYLLKYLISGQQRYHPEVLSDVIEVLMDNATFDSPFSSTDELSIMSNKRLVESADEIHLELSGQTTAGNGGGVVIRGPADQLIAAKLMALTDQYKQSVPDPVSITMEKTPIACGGRRTIEVTIETPAGMEGVGFCNVKLPANITIPVPGIKTSTKCTVIYRKAGALILQVADFSSREKTRIEFELEGTIPGKTVGLTVQVTYLRDPGRVYTCVMQEPILVSLPDGLTDENKPLIESQ